MKSFIALAAIIALVASQATWNPPRYSQGNPQWASQKLGGSATIQQAGCAMSSCAMMMAGDGVQINGALANPGSLDNWLKAHGGFSGNALVWGAIAPFGYTYQGKITGTSAIQAALKANKRVLLNVHGGAHWVLALCDNGSGFNVNDPGYQTTSYPYSGVTQASVYLDKFNSVYKGPGCVGGAAPSKSGNPAASSKQSSQENSNQQSSAQQSAQQSSGAQQSAQQSSSAKSSAQASNPNASNSGSSSGASNSGASNSGASNSGASNSGSAGSANSSAQSSNNSASNSGSDSGSKTSSNN
jgi:hypothetical protein